MRHNHRPDYAQALSAYEAFRARGMSLDMTRGKPASEQLDLSAELLHLPCEGDFRTAAGEDVRNYGGVQGLPELRALFSDILGVPSGQVALGNNSSLALMHDCLVYALLKGLPDGKGPWVHQGPVTFLCPVPGYDRHFALCETYGIRMIPVPLTGQGPDMDRVEAFVADPSIKGMWCVPQYSNPTGETYSDMVVERLAAMRTGAPDFRLFWDHAYVVHHLGDRPHAVANVLEACTRAGHPNRPLIFASLSKVTLAGAAPAALAATPSNLRWYLEHASLRSIGPDKLNQLRHARFFSDAGRLRRLMDDHRGLLAPKFRALDEVLERCLGETAVARWTQPEGGYFVTLEVESGSAKRVVELAAGAGLRLTPAGATHPYGRDPDDRTVRLAPSYPSVAEVTAAAEGIAACVLLAASEAMLRSGASPSATMG